MTGLLALVSSLSALASISYVPSTGVPPEPAREFRGAWIATVYNIDWPSRPGLPVARQKQEMLELLDHAAELHLNAVILQVRSVCDALYSSPYEPWSYYLTGTMGRPPEPFYDPLQFAIEEAHKRGLELHAWFNPFRAQVSDNNETSPRHVCRQNPGWIRTYSTLKWLDPGEPEVRAYVRKIILDVVQRYDIDGVHLDDYFYPYPVSTRSGSKRTFPDDKTWNKYGTTSGTGRSEWRQGNVNSFVQDLYVSIKAAKPWVKFGISPFGIWKPGLPEHTMAFIDAREDIHADSRLWLQKGWVDYFSPQLYWKIDSPEQSFTLLLNWWKKQNILGRNLWPGLATDRIGSDRPAQEILNEIRLTRGAGENSGHIFWSIRELAHNRRSVSDLLKKQLFQSDVLIPAYPWLGKDAVSTPQCSLVEKKPSLRLSWNLSATSMTPTRWLVQSRTRQDWKTIILDGKRGGMDIPLSGGYPDEIYVRSVDRNGNLGVASGLRAVEQLAGRLPASNIR